MSDIATILTDRLITAMASAYGQEHGHIDPLLRPSTNSRFGHYQANAAMSLGKTLGQKPRDVAGRIVEHVDVTDICEKVEIAGPGFINLTLSDAFLDRQLAVLVDDSRLGVGNVEPVQIVVVDYSGPNVAKEMHVGHLRSTVIGDAIARVLEFQGHQVIRQNHLGDWGTQFGMLIEHLVESLPPDSSADISTTDFQVSDLNAFYQQSKKKFDEDPAFADRARARVVALQGGDEATLAMWRVLFNKSLEHFDAVYIQLGVSLTDTDVRGESSYNELLPKVIESLSDAGLLQESQGAQVVYPCGFKDRDGNPMPMIIQKSDNGFLYATTDLAAARFRIDQLHAKRLIYVTDSRQSQHFAMVFATLRQADWAPHAVRLDHVPFGTVLGKDHKPFKTREGGTVKLIDLLDEAQKRAEAVIEQKNATLTPQEKYDIARKVGIGALKYADLSSDRIKDYVFDWDRMLAFEGNTAPYLQNAFVRIQSIYRKAHPTVSQGTPNAKQDIANGDRGRPGPIQVATDPERMLAVKILQLPGVIESVAQSLEPHRLCTYLYELASSFHQFYEKCPVLTAGDDATRRSRLTLCGLVARTLQLGLELLAIEVPDRM